MKEEEEEEEEEEDTSADSNSSGKTVLEGASDAHLEHRRKVDSKARRQTIDQKARTMDSAAEMEALKAGNLQPRTLEQLNSVDPIARKGQEFSCKELLVRVVEDCVKKQRLCLTSSVVPTVKSHPCGHDAKHAM